MNNKPTVLVGDFETTVFKGQSYTEVWASGVVEMYTENVKIHNSINETFDYLVSLNTNIIIYYHNLKFDGAFWISFLLTQLCYTQAVHKLSEHEYHVKFKNKKELRNKEFTYCISEMGQWYNIIIRVNNHFIEIRDSLKLLPFSVRKIGNSFGTKHKKLDMEYEGFRYAGCDITDEEREYIANDLLVVKEALEIMFDEGHKKLTIGSCCLQEFKRNFDKATWQTLFPDLQQVKLDEELYGSKTAGDYIRKSYKGGWCYLAKGKENKVYTNGTTADVNSLYPSMMSSESGNRYPIGKPTFWHGNYIPIEALTTDMYFFIRVKTRFYLKPNHLPTIQIKGSFNYRGTQWLETSDIYVEREDRYIKAYYDLDGNVQQARPTLTLTMTDFILFKDHYNLEDFEILDGCYFESIVGVFDNYMEKYKKIKMESVGAQRELAKLFLNNLYGKMATNTDSSFKYAVIKEDNSIGYVAVNEKDKQEGYIPCGSAITSYARNFTIRAAQKNYDSFVYADTDSIHCSVPHDKIKGIAVHPTNFCCWKLESEWDKAIFVRQKTYIEHVTKVCNKQCNMENVEPFYAIRCAGMPDRCKEKFEYSLKGVTEEYMKKEQKEYWDKLSQQDKEFITTKRELTDFKKGLIINGKLLPKTIRGGIVLVETTYEMR